MCSNYSLSICPYVSITIHRPVRGAGSAGAALPDLQLWHLTGARHRCFYVDGGRSQTFSSDTSWIRMGIGSGRCRRYWQHPSGGSPLTSLIFVVAAAGPAASTPYGVHHRRLQLLWWALLACLAAPSGGPPSTSSTSVVATAKYVGSTPQGAAIDVFNFGGGRCRTYRQHSLGGPIDVFNFGGGRSRTYRQQPPGGQPSMSPTSVVAVVGPTGSTSEGAHHRRLQLRWWPLSDLPPAPPGDPPSTSSTLVVATVGHTGSTPRGAPSTSSTSVVATAGHAGSTCRRPTIDTFNFGGGRCRTYRQHPPREPAINVFNFGGGRSRTCRQHPLRGLPSTVE
jgi:hypothetical protein